MTRDEAAVSGARLRLVRQARGFSQQQLARMAGVSRQAVSAVEAGHSDPSLRVALALARALGVTAEELFGPGNTPPPVAARPVAPLGPPGARVSLAPIGDSFVAIPLGGDTAIQPGFAPAGGIVTARDGEVVPVGPPRPTLVVAGCDPALPLLEAPLAGLDPPVGFAWWACSSGEALRLAEKGLVHVAGAHLRGRTGEYNTGPARQRLRQGGAEVLGFASWREGLVLRPDLAGQVGGLSDAARSGLRLVNRERGAEARRVLRHQGHRAPAGRGRDRGRARGHRGGERAGRARLRPGLPPARRGTVRPGHPRAAGRHPRGAGAAAGACLAMAARPARRPAGI